MQFEKTDYRSIYTDCFISYDRSEVYLKSGFRRDRRPEARMVVPINVKENKERLVRSLRTHGIITKEEDWVKIYLDGYQGDAIVSYHFFENTKTGHICNPKLKPGWSNRKISPSR